MRELDVQCIADKIAQLCVEANHYLGEDIKACIRHKAEEETWPVAKDVLASIEENIAIAEEGVFPLCQDTGMACVFLEIGQDVHLTGGLLEDAVNEGVRRGYGEGYLRKSIVEDPLRRVNMSRIKMLPPSAGEDGVKDFVVDTCLQAGANPCPPIVIGVGIGGTFDKAALLAKKALLSPAQEPNSDPYYAQMEAELLERINQLGIGPQGFGGKTTALAVSIRTAPTHIAGLPVAVNVNCHVSRHKEAVL